MTVVAQAFFEWDWAADNLDRVWDLAAEHLVLTAVPVALGAAIAFPLALAALRWRRLYGPLLGFTGVLFTIPSLALFVLLGPFTGFLSRTTAIIGLTLYTLLILLRNTVEGLNGVPAEVQEAAVAMGYRPAGLLWRVQVPLALPVIMAGLRIATVTTIGLVTVTALIGQGGLGQLFLDGFNRAFPTPLLIGLALSIVFAVVADLVLLGVQRALTPWARSRA